MILFCDRGCPFAHRVHALMVHLGRDYEVRESMVGDRPPGLEQYSASGRIPLLVHGDLVLTESRVILEHLAEYFDLPAAFPRDLFGRSRHRNAMAAVDEFLVPAMVHGHHMATESARRRELVDRLHAVSRMTPAVPNLLTLHVAPIWLRLQWWQPNGVVTRALAACKPLREWLDDTLRLECVQRTAPDRATHNQDIARARQAGLMPPEVREPA